MLNKLVNMLYKNVITVRNKSVKQLMYYIQRLFSDNFI